MKKFLCLAVLFLAASVIAEPSYFAFMPDSSTTTNQRMRRLMYFQTSQPPYTYIKKMDLTTADSLWVCPDSVWITAIYCARATTVKFQPRGGDTLSMPIDSLCGLPIDVKRLYKRGTDSLSWEGYIYLYGIINKPQP
jgi:hypothetical protein